MTRHIVPLMAPSTTTAPLFRAPLAPLHAALAPPLLPILGAQRIVPVLDPGRRSLAHAGLGARGRLRHLLP